MKEKNRKKIIIAVSVVLSLLVIADCSLYAYNHFDPDRTSSVFTKHEVNAETVSGILNPQKNLVTASYVYTNSETYEDTTYLYSWRVPLTTSKVRFTYSGTINIGFDTNQLGTVSIDNTAKKIELQLPDIKVLSCDIDPSSYYYDYETRSIFKEFSMDDVTDTMDQLEDKMVNKALSDEQFVNNARGRGRTIIEKLLKDSSETREYTVIWV